MKKYLVTFRKLQNDGDIKEVERIVKASSLQNAKKIVRDKEGYKPYCTRVRVVAIYDDISKFIYLNGY